MNLLVFGDAQNMQELPDKSIHLVVTSPPYFNAPFDYPDLFKNYEEYLKLMRNVAKEIHRVLADGRIVALVIDDILINGKKYPIVADITRIFIDEGFNYRERIVWIKPEGYIRISRRSGVLIQHPYPMYYYPDNLQESILLFQKGKFNYKQIPPEIKEASRINLKEYKDAKWYLNVWQITNVLPNSKLENGIAAFPEEIPYRLIKLFSYKGETVLDPFMGSGTTIKVAIQLGRKAVGYEIDAELIEVVKEKIGLTKPSLLNKTPRFKILIREDSKYLRTHLQNKISAAKKGK